MEGKEEEEIDGESSLAETAVLEKTGEGGTGRSKPTPGIIYLSRVPPFMKPRKVRHIFSQFGSVGRIYLQPEDAFIQKRRKKFGGNKKRNYTEGWVEFSDKRVAKAVAMAMNNTPVGGKKKSYYHDDLWNMKYLSKFRWTHLTEKIAYEQAVREQKMRTEISQAKRENAHYLQNVDKGKEIQAIVERKRKKGVSEEDRDGRTFKQRRTVGGQADSRNFDQWRKTSMVEFEPKKTHERHSVGAETHQTKASSSRGGRDVNQRMDNAASGKSLAKVKLSDAILRKILPSTAD